MRRGRTIAALLVAMGATLGSSLLEPAGEGRISPPPPPSITAAPSPVAPAATPIGAALPVRFEENRGQTDGVVRYVARAGGATLFLTDDAATLSLRLPPFGGDDAPPTSAALRMRVRGGQAHAPRAEQPLETRTNYFLGSDPSQWLTDVPSFGRVTYRGVLPGVDLVYRGDAGRLEYDLVVAPGADVDVVAMEIEGALELSVTDTGDLAVRTGAGTVLQGRPRVLQRERDGRYREIDARYRLVGEGAVGFEVASYDRARELVIDPVLAYSTYLGGSSTDRPFAIAVDATGHAYVTGNSFSLDFPKQAALQPVKAGGRDVVVAKLSPGGNALVYATFLGGTDSDQARDIAIDGAGSAVVVGQTSSTNFPTANALFATKAGGPGSIDAFVAKLAPSGSALAYATYVGGDDTDIARSVAVDATGSAYVTGTTLSANFPTASPFQATIGNTSTYDGFLLELDTTGTALVYSTYFGGTEWDSPVSVAVDATGRATIAGTTTSSDLPTKDALQPQHAGTAPPYGTDGFVARFTPSGAALEYSTYLGGSNGIDSVAGVAVDATSHAYVIGRTGASDFPIPAVKPGPAGRLFPYVVKLTASGTALEYGRYLDIGGEPRVGGLAVDGSGSVTFAVTTDDRTFPALTPIMPSPQLGRVIAGRLAADGKALLFSTYFGTGGERMAEFNPGRYVAADPQGNVYILGSTASATLPTRDPVQATIAGDYDLFVAKIAPDAGDAAPWTPSDAGLDGAGGDDARAPESDASEPSPLAPPGAAPPDELVAGGAGCDCRASAPGAASPTWLLAAAAAWTLRRRRRSSGTR